MAKPKVAILGIGIMGGGMAGRLLSQGFPLTVYNRKREKCTPFTALGARTADSPRDAASQSEIVISMVANDEASREIWLGEKGALAGITAGSLLIESSTLTSNWIYELSARASEHNCPFLDAPVTGTKPHAASGELVFLVGGSEEAVTRAQPVFSVLGRETFHLGPTGSGALMKLVNNFICGVQAASFAEALRLIDVGGLNRAKAISILTNGAPGSGIVKRVAERVAANEYTPNFMVRWMAKDLSYALKEASTRSISLQTAAAASSIFQRAVAEGHGDEDFSAVTKLL
ncbi:MAG TPA: NAD(P)-dependent oxidoreductase [Candidatus Solibacter sp.]|nr:NAD(P)-dependent oxidoreductase [Candidatus Solibacter sp.]